MKTTEPLSRGQWIALAIFTVLAMHFLQDWSEHPTGPAGAVVPVVLPERTLTEAEVQSQINGRLAAYADSHHLPYP